MLVTIGIWAKLTQFMLVPISTKANQTKFMLASLWQGQTKLSSCLQLCGKVKPNSVHACKLLAKANQTQFVRYCSVITKSKTISEFYYPEIRVN